MQYEAAVILIVGTLNGRPAPSLTSSEPFTKVPCSRHSVDVSPSRSIKTKSFSKWNFAFTFTTSSFVSVLNSICMSALASIAPRFARLTSACASMTPFQYHAGLFFAFAAPPPADPAPSAGRVSFAGTL